MSITLMTGNTGNLFTSSQTFKVELNAIRDYLLDAFFILSEGQLRLLLRSAGLQYEVIIVSKSLKGLPR